MSEAVFISAVQRITSGHLDLGGVITVATELVQAGQPSLAQQIYQVWIQFNPEHPQVYVAQFNRAGLNLDAGDVAGAKDALTQALAVNPEFLPAYINLGGVLERAGDLDGAIDQWRTVINKLASVTGTSIGYAIAALKQIGRVLADHQKMESAEVALQQCLTLNPRQYDVLGQVLALRMGQCKWPITVPWEGLDRKALVAGIHPLSMAVYTDDPMLQLAAASRYNTEMVDLQPEADLSCDRRHAAIDLNGRRLKVGYVSSDLRDHAVGYLMAELFEVHDRSKVEVFAYYCGPASTDGLNARIRGAVEHWTDIRSMTDAAAAAKIAADGVDILVDVNGHTRDAKTGLFSRRPAPIQVNWLGYPGTMGGPHHQYIVADPWIIPPDAELYYSEKVLRLPCYQPNDRKRAVAPERPTRAEADLPDHAVVFCCFNGPQKISRFMFARWMEILKRVEGSVLWLLHSTEETHERLRGYAEQAGVARERLIFAPKQHNAMHLARYPLADLFLDTSPYGAHTTASDSLWMGVPVLTLPGRAFASRVCGSLVSAAGLGDLVATSPQDYVERAVALGNDPAQLVALRTRLEAGRDTCDLFNMDKLVDRLEALYGEMVEDYQQGRLPQPDLTNLDAYFSIGTDLDHEGVEMLAVEDYPQIYKARLARRHLLRPLPSDGRFWTEADMVAAEALVGGVTAAVTPLPRKRAAGD
ncbi:tetratricopeptide repeat protein [Phenylobacterium aquaticum]|uniref:O-linked N-acetylglucosamine transferase, SPINDLY family protein n=1 Tax=Phenylobacterium aquaticum TaxID=1763816 RepID=UPI0026F3380C|nr:tetratricopeptide repeat protein [Phenylobacterium aquaticum]